MTQRPTDQHDHDHEHSDDEVLRVADGYHPTNVHRSDDIVVRDAGPWSPSVHALLRHLEDVGFEGAPRVYGSGFDAEGRETLSFIEGDFLTFGLWSPEAADAIGRLLRRLHDATASFKAPQDAEWYPWFGREMRNAKRGFGHCDAAPWNIVVQDGQPVALIDWERAGPVDPLVELAQACWLNAKLFDDVVAEREGLPEWPERGRILHALVDGYGLTQAQRRGFIDLLLEVAVRATADEADQAHVTPTTASQDTAPQLVWALSWRARSAASIFQYRAMLESLLG